MGFRQEIREAQQNAESKQRMAKVIGNIIGDQDHPEVVRIRVDAAREAERTPDFDDIRILKDAGW